MVESALGIPYLGGREAADRPIKKPKMVQMNVRIDADLKKAGDAVLAKAGYTPTDIVREIWEFAAKHPDDPEMVRDMLSYENPEAQAARKARRAEFEARQKEREELLARQGIQFNDFFAMASYKELRDWMYEERLKESELGA